MRSRWDNGRGMRGNYWRGIALVSARQSLFARVYPNCCHVSKADADAMLAVAQRNAQLCDAFGL